ncbi:MAG: DUF2905 domain-containing protein [Nitrospinota bacterium]|nr:DUF2905 domain-containing protein [Nitrospinota bacterium]
MSEFAGLGKVLLFAGIAIALFGALLLLSDRVPFLGKLPGDINIKRENFSFYLPLGTSILISVILTILFSFIGRK